MARPARERASGLAERLPAGASVAAVCRVTRHTVRFVSNDGFVLLTDRATLRSALAARESGNDESRRQICFKVFSVTRKSIINEHAETNVGDDIGDHVGDHGEATTLATNLATMATTMATTLAIMSTT